MHSVNRKSVRNEKEIPSDERQIIRDDDGVHYTHNVVLTHKAIAYVPAQRIVIDQDCTTIGRNGGFSDGTRTRFYADMKVKTHDMSMAKMQCIVKRTDESYFTIEEYSENGMRPSNGTWLNGERLVGPTLLKDGDVIRFGPKIEFTVSFEISFGNR